MIGRAEYSLLDLIQMCWPLFQVFDLGQILADKTLHDMTESSLPLAVLAHSSSEIEILERSSYHFFT